MMWQKNASFFRKQQRQYQPYKWNNIAKYDILFMAY